ncbi:MAG: hypothetical protein ACLSDJ_04265 [Butyricimonas faecihominis]
MTNEPFREKRQDADYTQWAVMHEGYFRLSPYTRLTAVAWYHSNECCHQRLSGEPVA